MVKNGEQGPSAPASTGVAGLDAVLNGGLTRNRTYLVEGGPGTGKTTLGLQFLLEGVRQGENGLYVSLSETEEELRAGAATHGWSLDPLSILELLAEEELDPEHQQSLLHPSEVEFGETTKRILEHIGKERPARIVFDSLSEMRLLAQSPLRYRRQILALKHFFLQTKCMALFIDDHAVEPDDLQLLTMVHGVITLEQTPVGYGVDRRRVRIVKMRGMTFRAGFHDFVLDTGGMKVFPRLIAAEHRKERGEQPVPSGVAEFDVLLGGGLVPGTSVLLIGPSGVGKTTTAARCVLSALERGEHVAFFEFDEAQGTLLRRSASLDMDLRPHLESGRLRLRQIDPAELSPGEFAARIRDDVEKENIRMVVIDSLNGYLQSMPNEKFLLLQMHELLSFLSQHDVISILVLGQHGLVGRDLTNLDVSYLSDMIVLLRFFEAQGEVRKAISVVKSRASDHERTIRELKIGPRGIHVGKVLSEFQGILSGQIVYTGGAEKLLETEATPEAE
jgi:circadian clock protein KaiC